MGKGGWHPGENSRCQELRGRGGGTRFGSRPRDKELGQVVNLGGNPKIHWAGNERGKEKGIKLFDC